MKNKIIMLRNGAGQYDGAHKPWTANEIIRIAIGLTLGIGVAVSFTHIINKAWAIKPVLAMVQSECQKDGENYDCTTSTTNAHLLDLASHGGVTWHDASEFEQLAAVEEYAKRYPKAKKEVIEKIVKIAKQENYADVDYLFRLISCESRLDPSEINTQGNSPATSVDRGLLQFNSYWQKKVSNDCAFDATCSLKTAIKMLKDGQNDLWSCHKIISKN